MMAVAALMTAPLAAQPATFASFAKSSGLTVARYDIDTPHSAIEFSVRFMGVSRVRGAFADFSGTVMYDSTDITRSSVSVVINVASINTNLASRDRDLKSPAFFDAEKFPKIVFRSSRVEQTASGLRIRGALTMHGVTKDIVIPAQQLHPLVKDAWDNRRMGFTATLTLSRREYGIMGSAFWDSEFDPGRLSVGDEVTIELMLSAELYNVDRWTTPISDSLRAVADKQGVAATLEQFRIASRDTTLPAGKWTEPILGGVGHKLMHRHKFEEAVPYYRLGTELRPERPALHNGLGEALLMLGKRTEAIASFRRALAIDSLNTVASEYLRRLER
jgi:polyisoprenoid-binding protein YceI